MTLAKRIIPCLDCDLGVPGGRVVKGSEFKRIVHAGVPWQMAARYSAQGAPAERRSGCRRRRAFNRPPPEYC